eukprot:30654-Pelagococcus_subviridis.AAC.1
MPAFASDPTSAPWRWAGAAVALPLCSLFGEAQFRLLRLDVRARARATCRRAPTPPNAPSSSPPPPRSPRSRSDPTTPGMATRSATRRVRGGGGGGGGERGGQETRSSQLSRSRPLPRANALFSTLLCVVALASPAILPLGLLGRILLALGAFQHACKVIEARRGYAPRGVVHAGMLRGYFASPIEPLAAQWSERAGTGDGGNGNGRGVRVDDAAEFNDRSFPFDDATRSDVRLAFAFCERAAAKLLFCVVVINALATDVTEVRPPPVPREKDFTRPTGIDPIDTYLAAWFLSIFFEGAMDLVAASQRDPVRAARAVPRGLSLPASVSLRQSGSLAFDPDIPQRLSTPLLTPLNSTPRPSDRDPARPRARAVFLPPADANRWNYPAKSVLKRLAYDPLRDVTGSASLAAAATYLASAALHEYTTSTTFYGYYGLRACPFTPGQNTSYFFLQFVATAIERKAARALRGRSSPSFRFLASDFARLLFVSAWLSCTTTLFLDSLRAGGLFEDIEELTRVPALRGFLDVAKGLVSEIDLELSRTNAMWRWRGRGRARAR